MNLTVRVGCFVVGAWIPCALAADLVGKVTFKGVPPPAEIIVLDKLCAELAKTNRVEIADYAIGTSNALAGVVVYLREAVPGAANRKEPVVIERKGCVYNPQIAAAQTNQPVWFRHSDPQMHNIRIARSEAGNPGVNFVQYAKAADFKTAFPKAEAFVPIKSDYQNSLKTYVYVLSTPHFLVTDNTGNFTFSNLPNGTYTVVAHHRLGGSQEKTVAIAGKNATNDFEFAK